MKVVSLFSGAGGLDLGLSKAGHEIVWANDIFLDAVSTYRSNIGDRIDTRDIREVPSNEIPACDVVVGGFPCQGFSVANWSRTSDDPRNGLFKAMVRIVNDKEPRYFVAENVKGLLSMCKGKAIEEIEAAFSAASRFGYRVQHQLVNAADYGVPQMRMRVIIVGVRSDQPDLPVFPPTPTHADPKLARKLGLKPWLSVGKALAHFPEPEAGQDIPNHENSKYKLSFNGYLGHRFIDPSKPSPTVTARGDDRGGVVVLHHPNNKRRMTARELAAVQSFPDDFVFSGTKTSAYRQIANAVPPLLGQAVGAMLAEADAASMGKEASAA
jgi:DNA (cytosine-5)-methyltransferase 1